MSSDIKEVEKTNVNGIIFGILGLIFGIISIFIFAPVFVPLAIIFSIGAIFGRQRLLGFTGLGTAFFGFITSPILMGLFAIASITAALAPHVENNSGTYQNSTQNSRFNNSQSNTQQRQSEIEKKLSPLTKNVSFKKCEASADCQNFYDLYKNEPEFAVNFKSAIIGAHGRMPSWIPYGQTTPAASGFIGGEAATIADIREPQNLDHQFVSIFYQKSKRLVGLFVLNEDSHSDIFGINGAWLGKPNDIEKAVLLAYEKAPNLIFNGDH